MNHEEIDTMSDEPSQWMYNIKSEPSKHSNTY